MFRFLRHRRRAKIVDAPCPEGWEALFAHTVPLWCALSPEEQAKLQRLVQIFLAEKRFEGAADLQLTPEMKATIAARACLLVLHRVDLDDPLYPDLDSVVVYPGAYRVRIRRPMGSVAIEQDQVRLGESWAQGTVVLAWDAVGAGSADPADGQDVVLHEFAHQLDAEDGSMDGAPALGDRRRYAAWAGALKPEYDALVQAWQAGTESDLRGYGATNPAEFFAVVTEAFFEQPTMLRDRHPKLYAELVAFYAMDTAAMLAAATTTPA